MKQVNIATSVIFLSLFALIYFHFPRSDIQDINYNVTNGIQNSYVTRDWNSALNGRAKSREWLRCLGYVRSKVHTQRSWAQMRFAARRTSVFYVSVALCRKRPPGGPISCSPRGKNYLMDANLKKKKLIRNRNRTQKLGCKSRNERGSMKSSHVSCP